MFLSVRLNRVTEDYFGKANTNDNAETQRGTLAQKKYHGTSGSISQEMGKQCTGATNENHPLEYRSNVETQIK